MEPSRDGQAPPNFLEAVRALADEHGVVLIFDEVSNPQWLRPPLTDDLFLI